MATKLQQEFNAEVEEFLERTNVPATTLGKLALGNTAFVSRLRSGAETKTSTMETVREWIKAFQDSAYYEAYVEKWNDTPSGEVPCPDSDNKVYG